MFEAEWNIERGWGKPRIVPFHDFSLHPFNTTLHYAQEGFEGMKAYRDPKGKIRTFRPLMNAERMVRTSSEICFPSYDPAEFVQCLDAFLKIDEKWVPAAPASLYIRPTIMSTTNRLGIHPPTDTMLFFVASPSSADIKNTTGFIKMFVETRGVRAWPGGSGHAKIGANYAIGLKYLVEATKKGYDQVLWLNGNRVSEGSGCAFFVYWINKKGEKELVTPALDGTILPSITRDTILQLAKKETGFITSEKPVLVTDLVKAAKDKRVLWSSQLIAHRDVRRRNSRRDRASWIAQL
jgi:branched-chain amino acid aminotransferase